MLDSSLRRSAVLDVETGPDTDAKFNAEAPPAGGEPSPALHRVTAAVLMTFDEIPGRPPLNLRFHRFGGDMREQELITNLDRVLPEMSDGNRLITFNGRAWDLPMLMQRAAATWCFSAPRLAGWSDAGYDRHIDIMRIAGPRGRRGWSSLADRAAANGIDMRLARGDRNRGPAGIMRRCTADVAATYLLYAADQAVRRCDAAFFGGAWIALAEHVRSEPELARDIRYIAEHPVVEGCRILFGRAGAGSHLVTWEEIA